MSNEMFKREDLKMFDLEELDGKILKISVLKDRNNIIVSGKDQETDQVYIIINSKFEKVEDLEEVQEVIKKVRCIVDGSSERLTSTIGLTEGKEYDVIDEMSNFYFIIDDSGEGIWKDKGYFSEVLRGGE